MVKPTEMDVATAREACGCRGACGKIEQPCDRRGRIAVAIAEARDAGREEGDDFVTLYSDRTCLVGALVAHAAMRGWRYGWKLDDALEGNEWPVVFVDLPTGQVSWHVARADFDVVFWSEMPRYEGTWDGHSTVEKLTRLRTWCQTEGIGGR